MGQKFSFLKGFGINNKSGGLLKKIANLYMDDTRFERLVDLNHFIYGT